MMVHMCVAVTTTHMPYVILTHIQELILPMARQRYLTFKTLVAV
jgi:hypothetical protein